MTKNGSKSCSAHNQAEPNPVNHYRFNPGFFNLWDYHISWGFSLLKKPKIHEKAHFWGSKVDDCSCERGDISVGGVKVTLKVIFHPNVDASLNFGTSHFDIHQPKTQTSKYTGSRLPRWWLVASPIRGWEWFHCFQEGMFGICQNIPGLWNNRIDWIWSLHISDPKSSFSILFFFKKRASLASCRGTKPATLHRSVINNTPLSSLFFLVFASVHC